MTEKPRNPETGIFYIKHWGYECARGFISDSRFAGHNSGPVIKKTNRAQQKKNRAIADKLEQARDWKSRSAVE